MSDRTATGDDGTVTYHYVHSVEAATQFRQRYAPTCEITLDRFYEALEKHRTQTVQDLAREFRHTVPIKLHQVRTPSATPTGGLPHHPSRGIRTHPHPGVMLDASPPLHFGMRKHGTDFVAHRAKPRQQEVFLTSSTGPFFVVPPRQIEGIVANALPTGREPRMRPYYLYWERQTLHALVKCVRNNIQAFHRLILETMPTPDGPRRRLLFRVDATLQMNNIGPCRARRRHLVCRK